MGLCIFTNVSFLSYFLSFTPSVNGFAEQAVSYIGYSELGTGSW